MGKCSIDHSHEDVLKKFHSQESYLPDKVKGVVNDFLKNESTQEELNDLFHLLKKYDLSSDAERSERNKKLLALSNG
ncbi:hypothetical protein [Virgibacillus sp. DJP39]|uniref:hypothetical protein n=1 Tax=Virgibacillus sp. DJP39 TaxID=3409790 RepID=UPI003BB728D4